MLYKTSAVKHARVQDFSERGTVQVIKKGNHVKCLKDRNDIYEWVLGSHFGSLIDLEQEMGQWSLMLTDSQVGLSLAVL